MSWDDIGTQASKGGTARAESLTAERRKAIARHAALLRHGRPSALPETEEKRPKGKPTRKRQRST